ncbi:MAG: class I SAM-dependent methyltransferase [Methylacidiphilales bacterium]|nr:class I SAM-dependent methyltransferase [Candidatus Methylacidiphilales bacterium]
MKSPLEDTIWGAEYGSVAAVQAAFDRFGPEYHKAILATGVPEGAARALFPHIETEAQGIDLGCGSGVLGLALREAGLPKPLDGVDLSPVMLELARKTGCYRDLQKANLLLPDECGGMARPYDFVITVGLIGDYVPYYVALPYLVSLLRPGGFAGFAVEPRSTPWAPLGKLAGELDLTLLSEAILPVPEGKLNEENYHFFVARRADQPAG